MQRPYHSIGGIRLQAGRRRTKPNVLSLNFSLQAHGSSSGQRENCDPDRTVGRIQGVGFDVRYYYLLMP